MTGLSVRLYWISNFIFDFTIYFCYFVAMFTLILIWDRAFGYGLYFANTLSTSKLVFLKCKQNLKSKFHFSCICDAVYGVRFGGNTIRLLCLVDIPQAIYCIRHTMSNIGDHRYWHGRHSHLFRNDPRGKGFRRDTRLVLCGNVVHPTVPSSVVDFGHTKVVYFGFHPVDLCPISTILTCHTVWNICSLTTHQS